MRHDYDPPGVAVHYSWPSEGSARGYAYDRDSALFARDGLEDLLRLLARSDADQIVISSHSMGSLLTVETLRQMSIGGDGSLGGKLSGLFLISPDIDQELFESQLTRLAFKPNPFVVFISQRDRALRLSSFLTGGKARLGTVNEPARLSELGIDVIDLSGFNDGDRLNHLTLGSSAAAISMMRGLIDIENN